MCIEVNKLDIPNIQGMNNLSEEEKQYAIKILKELSEKGKSVSYDKLLYADYKEVPVDIETFLDDDLYLGKALKNGEGKSTIYPYWRKVLKKIFPNPFDTVYRTAIFTGAIGLGKAQPLYSKVLTSEGYKPMGELSFGDKVYGDDGKPHSIIGIFPQGKKRVYEVTFSDGATTRCCDEHLWSVMKVAQGNRGKWRTVALSEILSSKIRYVNKYGHNRHTYRIPLTSAVEFEAVNHYIDPYLLGVLIGDGSLATYNGARFTSFDDYIVDEINNIIAPNGYVLHNQGNPERCCFGICKKVRSAGANLYVSELHRLGLAGSRSATKFIPHEYLYDCVENRVALLQGLMDTDGYISKDGATLQYSTVSVALCDGVVRLVRSLGGVAKVSVKSTGYKKDGEFRRCADCYTVSMTLPKEVVPFRLPRKVERINPRAFRPSRYIEDVRFVGEEECQCIMIDSESHLYVTDDFIVTHNSTLADVGIAYMIYRLICLKDPYEFYGLQRADTISFVFLNNTIDNAKDVAWKKLHSMLLLSPWFRSHGSVNNAKKDPEWQPPDGIDLIAGSSANHMIGRCVLGVFVDEANFSATSQDIEKQKKKMLDLVTSASIRMQSRFMKGEFNPTILFIASSKKDEQSFMETFIASKKKNDSKTTLIIDEPQWKIRTDKDSPIKFKVALGNKFLSNELLPLTVTEEDIRGYLDKGYTLLDVPMGYYEQFQDDIDKALMEIAGISTSGITKYLSGARIAKIKTKSIQNAFVKDIIEVGNSADDNTQYSDYFDMSRIDKDLLYKPMYIHLDMSISGDKTGICGTWVVGKKPHKDGVPDSKELFFRPAFSVSVKAPKGYQISFEKTRQFIYWLREQGFNIKMVTSDTYQNADLAQQLQSKGFNYKVLSVDRVNNESKQCEPYHYLKSAIYEERITLYDDCKLLTEELIGLEKDGSGRINHENGGRSGSKDQSDALCGSVYTASQYAEQYAYEYGEDIDATLNISQSNSPESEKEQINIAFQDELRKTFDPIRKDSKQSQYMDFGLGAATDNFEAQYISQGIVCW